MKVKMILTQTKILTLKILKWKMLHTCKGFHTLLTLDCKELHIVMPMFMACRDLIESQMQR